MAKTEQLKEMYVTYKIRALGAAKVHEDRAKVYFQHKLKDEYQKEMETAKAFQELAQYYAQCVIDIERGVY